MMPRDPLTFGDWTFAPRPGFRSRATPTGTEIGPGLTLHHDGAPEAVAAESAAPGTLRLTLRGFAGTWLSLALALPDDGEEEPSATSILGLAATLDPLPEPPPQVRLNVRMGVNLERVWRPLRAPWTEMDLFHLPHDPVAEAWFDLILAPAAEMDLTLSALALRHRLRASL